MSNVTPSCSGTSETSTPSKSSKSLSSLATAFVPSKASSPLSPTRLRWKFPSSATGGQVHRSQGGRQGQAGQRGSAPGGRALPVRLLQRLRLIPLLRLLQRRHPYLYLRPHRRRQWLRLQSPQHRRPPPQLPRRWLQPTHRRLPQVSSRSPSQRPVCHTLHPQCASSPGNLASILCWSKEVAPKTASRRKMCRLSSNGRFPQRRRARPRPVLHRLAGGIDLLPWPKVDFTKFGEIEPAAVAHQEDLGREPASQLGHDSARHQQRRGRYHGS